MKIKEVCRKGISLGISLVVTTFLGRFRLPQKPIELIPDNFWLIIVLVLYVVSFVAICIVVYIVVYGIMYGNLRAEIYLWRGGKMRGLWTGNGLNNQIEENSDKSSDIYIKVTRGVDLLEKDKKYGFEEIFRRIDENKELDRIVTVHVLLIIPCIKENHVQARYNAHKKKEDISEEKFLESWYKFLEYASDYKEKIHIITRFYFGNHSKWRFYIFSPPEDSKDRDKKIVLFSDYDENSSDGRLIPMYKVIEQERNIGGFMMRYFDEIWKESLTPDELSNAIEKGEIKSKGTYSKRHNCTGCHYSITCKKFIKEYGKYLK